MNNNNKQQMYHLINPYVCPICGQEMLMFTTDRNTIVDYKAFIKCGYSLSEMKEDLSKRKVNGIKCLRCGEREIIDWSDSWPTPLYNIKILTDFGVI